MRRIGDLVLGAAVIGLLSMSTGCVKKSEAGLDAKTAAVNGGGAKAATDSSSSPSSPASSSSPAGRATRLAPASDPLHPLIEIQTSKGNITVELDGAEADLTVRNFLRYVDNGDYDQTIFHQVLKDYVIMGGGYAPPSQAQGKPVEKKTHPPIRNEAQKCRLKNTAGTIAMVAPALSSGQIGSKPAAVKRRPAATSSVTRPSSPIQRFSNAYLRKNAAAKRIRMTAAQPSHLSRWPITCSPIVAGRSATVMPPAMVPGGGTAPGAFGRPGTVDPRVGLGPVFPRGDDVLPDNVARRWPKSACPTNPTTSPGYAASTVSRSRPNSLCELASRMRFPVRV